MSTLNCLPANPNISGIGVCSAIYAQNLLCFLPVIFYLWDSTISQDELAGIRDQSIGMLAVTFSILITTAILAKGTGGVPSISNYHAVIVLNLSWMNNTSTWIWFILFVHHRSTLNYKPTDATWEAWCSVLWSPIAILLGGRWTKGREREGEETTVWRFLPRLICLLKAAPVLTLSSIHLSFMAAIGIWLWITPSKFGLTIPPTCHPTLTVLGASVPFSSAPLHIFSLMMYALLLIPGLHLLPPFLFFLTLHISYNWVRSHSQRFDRACNDMEQSRKFFWGILRSNKAPNALDLEVRVEVSSQAEIDFFLSFFQAVLAPPVESASDQNLPGTSSPCTSTTSSTSTNHSHPVVHTDSPVPVNTAFLIVGLVCLVAVNIFFIIDIELTLGRNS